MSRTTTKNTAAALSDFDLYAYVPFYLTVIANKLTRSASRLYLEKFDVGIVEWRALCTLGVRRQSTAKDVCDLVGLDKAAVSRAFKRMEDNNLIRPVKGEFVGRNKPYEMTALGQRRYEEILEIALAREDAALKPLDAKERRQLLRLLQRIYENLHVGLGDTED